MIHRDPQKPSTPPDDGSEPKSLPPANQLVLFFALSIVAGMFVTQFFSLGPPASVLPYSEFQALLADGQVERATVASDVIRGELAAGNDTRSFVTYPVDAGVAAEGASVCTSADSICPKKEWEMAWKGVMRSFGSYESIFMIRSRSLR